MSPDSDSEPLVQPAEASDEPAASPAPPSGGSGRRGRGRRGRRNRSENMLPQRERRPWPERMLVRLVATCGIVGIGTAISAIMVSSNDQGWMVGIVVSVVSVVLAAVLWSSRVL